MYLSILRQSSAIVLSTLVTYLFVDLTRFDGISTCNCEQQDQSRDRHTQTNNGNNADANHPPRTVSITRTIMLLNSHFV